MKDQLSPYIQSCIISRLLGGLNNAHHHGGKDTFRGSDFWYIVFHGEKKRLVEPITSTSIIDIALVSKWWLHVVRQRSTSVHFRGHLDSVILQSIHSSPHSLYSSNNIDTIKWTLALKDEPPLKKMDYETQLIHLPPKLQTINVQCNGNVNVQVMESLKSIQTRYPHIVINTEFVSIGQEYYSSIHQWPKSLKGFTPNTASLGFYDFQSNHPDDDSPLQYTKENNLFDMIRDLQPQSLNLYTDQFRQMHSVYKSLFKQLCASSSTPLKHLSINTDHVELCELKHLPSHLESLKLDIGTIPLYGPPPNEDYSPIFYRFESSMQDWISFCNSIANNRCLKRLHLYDHHYDCHEPLDQEKLNIFQSAFDGIWSGGGGSEKLGMVPNNNIDYLALVSMPNVMSSNLWSTLCDNNNITKLILAHGTVTNAMVPLLANLIATNTTITVLSIRGNELLTTEELEDAFVENKTITVLDIGLNFCKEQDEYYFFDALLSSDTVQYLFLDKKFRKYKPCFETIPYFTQSKSLIEFILDKRGLFDSPYFNNSSLK
ncbi:hypothetical protein DFA_04192 [Cavenderia fasciculata]|uniref:Uncharacterized protein n=1 Tax=Cavenderia fasciculata TaxID=261658 RepID=F4Q1J5_CACFS|nr:uncharacterized protein DFA_04192 [Cavenderia fasciculata]EGG18696.1 hypothetical protein DFA_04192 [Cavenderia fasciculata]|eukprot:XP_004366600.1 hypothetical protein DFA_04192 [Cavenderia fasciculata]